MSNKTKVAKGQISPQEHTKLTKLRQQFHSIPELGFDEHKTSDLICKTLDEIGIPYERGIADTGIVASLKMGDGSAVVGFRADIDALPINEATNLEYRTMDTPRCSLAQLVT